MEELKELNLKEDIKRRIEDYIKLAIDEENIKIKKTIKANDLNSLSKWFSTDIDFGTGGLRGIMDIGSSYINQVTILKASYATVNYFSKLNSQIQKSICISYDTRKNSEIYGKISAIVAAKKGYMVYFTEKPMPTPFLSFITRNTKSLCGIMITASHNPKEYNGYKVYDETGCQILPKIADEIIKEYKSLNNIEKIDISEFDVFLKDKKIKYIDEKLIDSYIACAIQTGISKIYSESKKSLIIVYTSLHGTGISLFKKYQEITGLNCHYVESQINFDPDFANVRSLNPENKESFTEAIELAKKVNADIAIATDPDADRVGFAFIDKEGYFIPTGNEIAIMLFYYICFELRKNEYDHGIKESLNYYAVTTIVTSDLLEIIGRFFGFEIIKTLTGFKYIGHEINKNHDKKFIFAAEESNGYLLTDKIRDKDSISTINMVCEFVSFLKAQGIKAKDYLYEIYKKFGFYFNDLINLDFSKEIKKDLDKDNISYFEENPIEKVMNFLRENPLESINEKKIRKIIDYKKGYNNFPESDLLQYFGENFKITIRPSGTEPKLKIYFQIISRDENSGKELLETFKNFFINLLKNNLSI